MGKELYNYVLYIHVTMCCMCRQLFDLILDYLVCTKNIITNFNNIRTILKIIINIVPKLSLLLNYVFSTLLLRFTITYLRFTVDF